MGFFITVVFLGMITGAIAHKKGHSFAKWWFYGAALFIVALPMAIMLKPVGAAGVSTTAAMGGLRKCPRCAELIQPEAQFCRFCNAEVIPMSAEEQKQIKIEAEREAKKATYVPGWLVVVVFAVVALFIYAMAHNSPPSGGSSGNPINAGLGGVLAEDYIIKVTGSDSCKFSGSYMVVTADGQSQSKSVEGRVPTEYQCRGSIVSTSFQKQGESGMLKVQIMKGGRLVNESETSAAYGVVSAASN